MLVTRGLAPSRARAQDLIKRGFVLVGGSVCDKPAQDVKDHLTIEISSAAPAYVSRGAEKLLAALDRFGFDPSKRTCLDVGASTGGFTEALLERGAARVYAVDVGTAQLHARVRDDARVVSLENFDARRLSPADVPDPISAITVDVSFISVTKLLAPALQLAVPGAWMVVLVKPQFEVGRENIGSGGIVRDEAARQGALESVRAWIESQPTWTVVGEMPSPILGGSGNSEFLLGALRND